MTVVYVNSERSLHVVSLRFELLICLCKEQSFNTRPRVYSFCRRVFRLFRLALDLRYHELIFSNIMNSIRMIARTFLIQVVQGQNLSSLDKINYIHYEIKVQPHLNSVKTRIKHDLNLSTVKPGFNALKGTCPRER